MKKKGLIIELGRKYTKGNIPEDAKLEIQKNIKVKK